MDQEIKPNQIYTTEEAQEYLRVSNSTIKRLLKNGISILPGIQKDLSEVARKLGCDFEERL